MKTLLALQCHEFSHLSQRLTFDTTQPSCHIEYNYVNMLKDSSKPPGKASRILKI